MAKSLKRRRVEKGGEGVGALVGREGVGVLIGGGVGVIKLGVTMT